jgi:hypothetical protein
VADHRDVILLVLIAWLIACAGVSACCIAASRGDESL